MSHIIITNLVLNITLAGIAHACGHPLWPLETWDQFSFMTMNIVGAVLLTIMLHRFEPWLKFMYFCLCVLIVVEWFILIVFLAATAMGY